MSSRGPLQHAIHLSKPSSKGPFQSRRPIVTYGTSAPPDGRRSLHFQSHGWWRPRFRRRGHTSTEDNRVVPGTPCWNKDLAEPRNPVGKIQSVSDNEQTGGVGLSSDVVWSDRCTCHAPAVCPTHLASLTGGQELSRYATTGYGSQGTIAFPGGDAGSLFWPGDYCLRSAESRASDLDRNPDSSALYGRSVQDSGISPGHDLLVRLGNDGTPLSGIAYNYGAQDVAQIADEAEPSLCPVQCLI